MVSNEDIISNKNVCEEKSTKYFIYARRHTRGLQNFKAFETLHRFEFSRISEVRHQGPFSPNIAGRAVEGSAKGQEVSEGNRHRLETPRLKGLFVFVFITREK